MGFNVRFHHMPPAQESPTSPFRLDLVITFQKLFLGRWTRCCCASNRMKLAKWASIYHGNLRVDYPLIKPYLLEAGGIGGGVPLNFHEVYNLRVSLMLKRTPFPQQFCSNSWLFGLSMLSLPLIRVSLNSNGWLERWRLALLDQGIKLGYLWNCSWNPIIMVFSRKMAGYLKGNRSYWSETLLAKLNHDCGRKGTW